MADPNTAKEAGNVAFAAGNYEEAIKCFSEAISVEAENEIHYSNRSAAYLKAKKHAEALADAEKCIQLKPDWGKGYARKGAVLVVQGEYAAAVAVYATGLAKEPTNTVLLQGLQQAQKELTSGGDKEKKKAKGKKKKKDGKKKVNDVDELAGVVDNMTVGEEDKKDADDDEDDKESKENSSSDQTDHDYVIGVDLGTTFSCVGVWKDDGVLILTTDTGEKTIPSYVAFLETGERVVGAAAKNQAVRNPANTLYDVKRIIGRKFTDSGVDQDIRKYPYKVIQGPENKPVVEVVTKDGKKQFAPEQISAMVLSYCKELAERTLGQPVRKAVITVPAYFNDAQRNATKAAGIIAGLEVLRIINEPTAAALSYGLDNVAAKKKEAVRVLIFDLGGGTFDVSILSIEAGVFTVVATGGDTRLGGEDFDHNTIEFLLNEIEKAGCPKSIREDPRALQRVRKAAEQAKRQLSNSVTAQITLDALVGNFNFKYKLTKEKFEQLNRAQFLLCLDVVKRVLKDAKLKAPEIDEIVLVGGSTRIPKIQTMLQEMFGGKQLCKTVNPDEAVAYGAAVQGAILNGKRNKKTQDLLLMDVTPLSLGIETTGRVMSVVIPRNTPIPCVKTQTYTTEQNYQTKVDVSVYEGERLKSDENNLLGEFTISGIESAKRGEPQIEVSFSIDSDGILNVKAVDQKTKAEAAIQIANRSKASNEDIEKMVKEAEKFKKEDQERLRRVEARNELEHTIYQVLEIADGLDDAKMAGILRGAAEKEQQWLDDGQADEAKPSEIALRRRNLARRIQNRTS